MNISDGLATAEQLDAEEQAIFDGLKAVYLRGLEPLHDQNDALRFVHFVDQLYNLGLDLKASGAPLKDLFPESYRHGAFAKKYGRALSRLAELLG